MGQTSGHTVTLGKRRSLRAATPKYIPTAEEKQLIADARIAHRDYLKLRDAFVQWNSKPETSGERFIAQWCDGLGQDKKYAKHIVTDKLKIADMVYADVCKKMREEIETAAHKLTGMLSDARTTGLFTRMGWDGKLEWASLVQGLGESVAGGSFIERELNDSEGFWSSVMTKKGSAEADEKLDARKKGFELAEPWLDALAEFAGTIVRTKQEKAVEYVAELISIRFNVKAVNLITHESIEIRGGMVAARLYSREVTVLKSAKLISKGNVEAFTGVLGAVGKVVAVVNFVSKMNVAYQDPTLKNVISATGSLAELLGAFKSSEEYVNKFVRFGRTVGEDGAPKAIEATTDAAEIAAEGGEVAAEGLGKIFLEGVAKKAGFLAVVGGLCDAVTGSQEAYDAYEKGDFAGTASKMAVAGGGILVAVGAGLMMAGGGTSATIVGAPVGVVLFIVGAIVGAAGAICNYFFSESDLELWVEHCFYGKRYGQDEYADYQDNFPKQIGALSDLLYTVKVKGDLKQDTTLIDIEPSSLTKTTKITCFVNATSDNDQSTMMTARQELPLRDDQGDCTIEFEDSSVPSDVKQRLKAIKLTVTMPDGGGANWASLNVNMKIDVDGDGSNVLTRSAVIKQGTMSWIWSKL